MPHIREIMVLNIVEDLFLFLHNRFGFFFLAFFFFFFFLFTFYFFSLFLALVILSSPTFQITLFPGSLSVPLYLSSSLTLYLQQSHSPRVIMTSPSNHLLFHLLHVCSCLLIIAAPLLFFCPH